MSRPCRRDLRDAAFLACTLKPARDAYLLSAWPRRVRISESGYVHEPASGAFDVIVAPSENVQAAVERCPPGGCVLLLPGFHAGPLVLGAIVAQWPPDRDGRLPLISWTASEVVRRGMGGGGIFSLSAMLMKRGARAFTQT